MARPKGAKNKPKTTRPKMSFNERVRKVIHGEAETKEKVVKVFEASPIRGTGLVPVDGRGATIHNLLELLAVAQGDEQEQREGNKIEDCRLRVRGVIQSTVFDATTNNSLNGFEVHMVAFKLKKDIANGVENIKQLFGNQTGYASGTLMNSCFPYNKDGYIFRKIKTFRLRPLGGEYPRGS